ncbi:MAG: preprotein translocase subunit SecG [Clostridiales bacterium]|nr:preprotein translocase subunit SecG [Clostridiales bacterium]
MSVLISIILILASLVLIVAVLMQEGNKQGLGAIGGAAETFLGKNKAKSAEGKLLKITKIVAVIFVALALVATFISSRTYSVRYYTEDGKEYFPYLAMFYPGDNYEDGYAGEFANSGMSEKEWQDTLRSHTTYKKGAEVTKYSAPSKVGYSGSWVLAKLVDKTVTDEEGKTTTVKVPEKVEGEVPATMGSSNVVLMAEYSINSYTVSIVDDGIPAQTPAEAEPKTETAESETAETEAAAETAEEAVEEEHTHNVIFTVTANYGEAIDYSGFDKLPEAEGYLTFFSTQEDAVEQGLVYQTPLPETIPGEDATYYVCYAKGNYVTYWVDTTVTEEVDEPVLDSEGIETKDEEGNVITQKVTKPVLDADGNKVTEPKEWFPKLSSELVNEITSEWEEAYSEQMGEDLGAYLEAYLSAISDGGEITTAVSKYYSDYVEQYTKDDRLDIIRMFVNAGEALPNIGAPTKDGMVGVWEPELEVMGSEPIKLTAVYYPEATLTIYDDGLNGEKLNAAEDKAETDEATDEEAPAAETPSETPAEESSDETAETNAEEDKHNVIFTYSGEGRTINYNGLALPEAPEGYSVSWSEELPEKVPAGETVIFVVYSEITSDAVAVPEAEETAPEVEDDDVSAPTEEEPTEDPAEEPSTQEEAADNN